MNQIILPVVSDFEQASQWIKSMKLKQTVYYVGVTSDGKDFFTNSKTVKVFVFANGSAKEEIINSLSSEMGDGKVVILRKLITKDELEKFLSSETDVTVCATKKRSKFANFFYKIWEKMVKMLFDFKFFDGDISVVAIGERLSPVTKHISNLSHATRVNRWKGVTTSSVETTSPPAKKEYNHVGASFMLIGWLMLFLAVVAATTVYFLFQPATFLSVFLWICALVVSLLCFYISVAVFVLYTKTGKRLFRKAKREE